MKTLMTVSSLLFWSFAGVGLSACAIRVESGAWPMNGISAILIAGSVVCGIVIGCVVSDHDWKEPRP